ncbi:MAG: F0F1 ATP synthase subunit epsilon [Clostridia bacterium]|nr:F0F1 ATP synthase subunit epsilon [Clostridia bacterium]
MNTFKLKISTPDGDMFDGEAVKLDVRGIEGELAVMAGHIPFMTAIKPCDCKLLLDDGSERIGTLEGGLLSVGSDCVTLLASGYKWK